MKSLSHRPNRTVYLDKQKLRQLKSQLQGSFEALRYAWRQGFDVSLVSYHLTEACYSFLSEWRGMVCRFDLLSCFDVGQVQDVMILKLDRSNGYCMVWFRFGSSSESPERIWSFVWDSSGERWRLDAIGNNDRLAEQALEGN